MVRRNAGWFLVMIALMTVLGRQPAHAGHYDVSYSNGSLLYDDGGGFPYFVMAYGGYGGATGGYSWDPNGIAIVQCSGTITTTFTWMPDYEGDVAPNCAIVCEQSSAEAGLYGSKAGTCTADDGLGDAQTVSFEDDNDISVQSAGTRYQIKTNPGNSFTIFCTPGATSSPTALNTTYVGGVSYSAEATPVTVDLGGVLAGTPPNVLIGQGVTAGVSTGRYQQTAWSWTLSGDPFAGFQLSSTDNMPQTGHAVELAAADLTHASVSYFYRSIGNKGGTPPAGQASQAQTVSCSVTITDPNNPNMPPMQVTGTTTLNVDQPDHTFTPTAGSVNFWGHLQSDGVTIVSWLQANALNGRGMTWTASVTTPAMFLGEEGAGIWNFTQVIRSDTHWTINGVVYYEPHGQLTGLDGTFPYEHDLTDPTIPITHAADGSSVSTGDSPGHAVGSTMTRIQLDFTADTWMLYMPPSSNGYAPTTWVPLHKQHWHAHGWGQESDGWDIHDAGIDNSDSPISILPEWIRIIMP